MDKKQIVHELEAARNHVSTAEQRSLVINAAKDILALINKTIDSLDESEKLTLKAAKTIIEMKEPLEEIILNERMPTRPLRLALEDIDRVLEWLK